MKIFTGFFIVLIAVVWWPTSMKAQDVYISVPANNIFNRTEFTTTKNILNTGNNTNWRIGFFAPIWPEIRSTSGNNFSHSTLSNVLLPTDVLHWRLASIGGEYPPFRSGDTWPFYKWFTSSDQTWYEPRSVIGGYTAGNVAFNFKIPSNKYINNIFYAGNYSIGVTHNYGSSLLHIIEFTPNNLQVILAIPAAIQWISNTPTKTFTISDLTEYRSSNPHLLGDLGVATIGSTVDFNLHAKASSSLIQFTSSKGVTGTRAVSFIKLGSTPPKLNSLPLSSSWQNYTTSSFGVATGNRNSFTPQLSIAATDFKAQFYQAGTYTFELNLDAKSTDNSISALQNTNIIIKVNPLSEISIPISAQTVNFEFNTAAHYQQGQSQVIPNQIKLSNNETFELYVKSDSNSFKKAGVQTDINANILEVGVGGSTSVPLSTSPQKIISAGAPVLDQELNTKYNIPATAAQSLIGKEKTTYSINVIYSFTAI